MFLSLVRNRNITETQLFRWPGQAKQMYFLKEHLAWRNRWVVLYSALRPLYLSAHCGRLETTDIHVRNLGLEENGFLHALNLRNCSWAQSGIIFSLEVCWKTSLSFWGVEGRDGKQEWRVGPCVVITGHGMKEMLRIMLLWIYEVIDCIHNNFYK